jgi:hypothetical protein
MERKTVFWAQAVGRDVDSGPDVEGVEEEE